MFVRATHDVGITLLTFWLVPAPYCQYSYYHLTINQGIVVLSNSELM